MPGHIERGLRLDQQTGELEVAFIVSNTALPTALRFEAIIGLHHQWNPAVVGPRTTTAHRRDRPIQQAVACDEVPVG